MTLLTISTIFLVLSLLIVCAFIVNTTVSIHPYLKFTAKLLIEYVYLFLIPIPLFFIWYYYSVYLPQENKIGMYTPEIMEYAKNISYLFFSAGIFSGTVKFINSTKIFEKRFEKIIMSDKFGEMISDKLLLLTFSNEHLSKIKDLDENWKKITLCKYEQKFPELMDKLKKNIQNELFEENNLSCYYKHFQIQINIELVDKETIKITEITTFTAVPTTSEPIDLDFWISKPLAGNHSKNSSQFVPEKTFINNLPFNKYIDEKSLREEEYEENGINNKHYIFSLSGKSEYHIERHIELIQDINHDRLYGFASSKIIDDISIHIQYGEDLGVYFSPIGANKFYKTNVILEGESYSNRDVLLPGEKFNVFIFRK